jgi:hypothetical protein
VLDAGTFWCARCASCNAGSRRSCTSHRAARLNARGQRDQREILRLDPLPQRVHRLEGERHDHRQCAAGARAARAASAGRAAGRRRARGRGALESSRALRVGWGLGRPSTNQFFKFAKFVPRTQRFYRRANFWRAQKGCVLPP